jgi:hypothetical protein
MTMYDLIADLFNQAANLYATITSAGQVGQSAVFVDYSVTTTPTNTLNGPQNSFVSCLGGTLVYAPGFEYHYMHFHGFYPATFSLSPGSTGPQLRIFGWHLGVNSAPAIQFQNLALAPPMPPLASPTSINVDGTTKVIYGVVGSGPAALFVTITLFNIRQG